MAIHTYNKQASPAEMAAEIDRRGAVIETLEAKIEALSARLTPSAEVVRYGWVRDDEADGGRDVLPTPDGEYVRYEDHAAALAASEAKRKEAEAALREIADWPLEKKTGNTTWGISYSAPHIQGIARAALDQPKPEDAA